MKKYFPVFRFGFQWPDSLACDKFPISGLCVGEDNKTQHLEPGHDTPSHGGGSYPNNNNNNNNRYPGGNNRPGGGSHQGGTYPNKTWVPGRFPSRAECPKEFHVSASYNYKLQIDQFVAKNCGMPCNDDIFFGSKVCLTYIKHVNITSSIVMLNLV